MVVRNAKLAPLLIYIEGRIAITANQQLWYITFTGQPDAQPALLLS